MEDNYHCKPSLSIFPYPYLIIPFDLKDNPVLLEIYGFHSKEGDDRYSPQGRDA